jgi:uncharacterized membrane protein YfcA
MNPFYFIFIGVFTGIISGLFGVGGGIMMVPIFTYALGFALRTSVAISLTAMLLPVGALALYKYFQENIINGEQIRYGLLTGVGIFIGAYFGAKLSLELSNQTFTKVFGAFILLVSLKLIFGSH